MKRGSDSELSATLALVARCRQEAEISSRRALFTTLVISAQTRFGGNASLALSGANDRASLQLRDVALYLLHTCYGLKHAECGAVAGIARWSASRAIARIEDQREDAAFNWRIEGLEALAGGRAEEAA